MQRHETALKMAAKLPFRLVSGVCMGGPLSDEQAPRRGPIGLCDFAIRSTGACGLQMASAGLLQALPQARLAPCSPAAPARRHPQARIASVSLSAAPRRARRAMTALAQASAQAPASAGPGAGEDFEGLKGFEDRRAEGH